MENEQMVNLDGLSPDQVFHVILPQNCRIKIELSQKLIIGQDIQNAIDQFKKIFNTSAGTLVSDQLQRHIHVDNTFEEEENSLSIILTFFKIPTDLENQLKQLYNTKNFKNFKFYIGKQWMEKGELIKIEVLNAKPNTDELAYFDKIGIESQTESELEDISKW